jgi:hypothetical protein
MVKFVFTCVIGVREIKEGSSDVHTLAKPPRVQNISKAVHPGAAQNLCPGLRVWVGQRRGRILGRYRAQVTVCTGCPGTASR